MCKCVCGYLHAHQKKLKSKLHADWLFVIIRTRPVCRAWGLHAETSGLCCCCKYFQTLFPAFFRRCFRYISKQWVSRLKCGFVKPPAGNCSESQGQRMSSCKALWSWCWNQKMESVSGSIKFSHLQWPVVLKYHHSCGLLCFCLLLFGLLNVYGNRNYRYATGPFVHRSDL